MTDDDRPTVKHLDLIEIGGLLEAAETIDKVAHRYERRVVADNVDKRTLTMLAVLSMKLNEMAANATKTLNDPRRSHAKGSR